MSKTLDIKEEVRDVDIALKKQQSNLRTILAEISLHEFIDDENKLLKRKGNLLSDLWSVHKKHKSEPQKWGTRTGPQLYRYLENFEDYRVWKSKMERLATRQSQALIYKKLKSFDT